MGFKKDRTEIQIPSAGGSGKSFERRAWECIAVRSAWAPSTGHFLYIK